MGRHGRLQHGWAPVQHHADTRESGLSRRNTTRANSVCLHRPGAAVVHRPPAIAATASPYHHGPVVALLLGTYRPLVTPVSATSTSMTITPITKTSGSTPRRTLDDEDRRRICEYHESHPGVKQIEISGTSLALYSPPVLWLTLSSRLNTSLLR